MPILPCSFLNEVGICDCEAGWQGTSCNISAEAALQGNVDEDSIASQCGTFDTRAARPSQWLLLCLPQEQELAKVPSAASWIATSAATWPNQRKISGRLAGWYMTAIQHIKPFQTQGLRKCWGVW